MAYRIIVLVSGPDDLAESIATVANGIDEAIDNESYELRRALPGVTVVSSMQEVD